MLLRIRSFHEWLDVNDGWIPEDQQQWKETPQPSTPLAPNAEAKAVSVGWSPMTMPPVRVSSRWRERMALARPVAGLRQLQ